MTETQTPARYKELMKDCRYLEAEQLMIRCMEQEVSEDHILGLAAAQYSGGKQDCALLTLTDGIDRFSESVAIRYNLGKIYELDGDFVEAASVYEEIIRLELPATECVVESLASICCNIGDWKRTIFLIDKYKEKGIYASSLANLSGIAYERSGDKESASQKYRESIELDSENIDPYLNLGYLLEMNGKNQEALNTYMQAIKRDNQNVECNRRILRLIVIADGFECGLLRYKETLCLDRVTQEDMIWAAVALTSSGRISEELVGFLTRALCNTNLAESSLVLVLNSLLRIREAEAIVSFARKSHSLLDNREIGLCILKALDQKDCYSDIIVLYIQAKGSHGYLGAYHHLIAAKAYYKTGDISDANNCIDSASKVVRAEDEYILLADLVSLLRGIKEGLAVLEQGLESNPQSKKLLLQYCQQLVRVDMAHKAIAKLVRSLRFSESDHDLINSLGVAFYSLGNKNDWATRCWQQCILLSPGYAEPYNNLATLRREEGSRVEAEQLLRKAIELDGEYTTALTGLATLLLQRKEYTDGYRFYEYRLKADGFSPPIVIPSCSRWNGRKTTRPIVVIAEQGLGDIIQFIRFVIDLVEDGFTVYLCITPMQRCIAEMAGIERLCIEADQVEDIAHSRWIPLMSLPYALGLKSEADFMRQPYLMAPEPETDKLKHRLVSLRKAESFKRVIGLCWQGNPRIEYGEQKERSIRLENFLPLARNGGDRFISLQKGIGSDQVDKVSFRSLILESPFRVLEHYKLKDTSQLISLLDIVITIDTSVAHLAGAMGRPTILLLTDTPDWRWGVNGLRTEWYETMRIYRRCKEESWPSLIERLATDLIDDTVFST